MILNIEGGDYIKDMGLKHTNEGWNRRSILLPAGEWEGCLELGRRAGVRLLPAARRRHRALSATKAAPPLGPAAASRPEEREEPAALSPGAGPSRPRARAARLRPQLPLTAAAGRTAPRNRPQAPPEP